MFVRKLLTAVAFLALVVSCSSKPQLAQLSGKVTFKGEPVPAGWISFTPDVGAGGLGQIKVFQIKDGVYDSSQEDPPGLNPGQHLIEIAGFDGKKIPFYGQGKQIFNPVKDQFMVPSGTSTKDWVIPESAGKNVRIQPTADS
ncbi:MAG: hypothetical protein L0Z62_49725 [Gemmataceae bacterium]|nr:hypothetical protein [Gemmataceae bacterium]